MANGEKCSAEFDKAQPAEATYDHCSRAGLQRLPTTQWSHQIMDPRRPEKRRCFAQPAKCRATPPHRASAQAVFFARPWDTRRPRSAC
jgi:hypothetical protein